MLTSLALPTLERERRAARELAAQTEHEVEIDDLTLLRWMRQDRPFSVGPLVNVYNENTLAYLARQGARRFCLPPELPIASVERAGEGRRGSWLARRSLGLRPHTARDLGPLLSRARPRAQQGFLPVRLRGGRGRRVRRGRSTAPTFWR